MKVAAFVVFASAITSFHADAAAPQGSAASAAGVSGVAVAGVAEAASPAAQGPGKVLVGLAGRTFGHVTDDPEAYSMLLRFEQDPGGSFRIVEVAAWDTQTTHIAAGQRGPNWRGTTVYERLDTKVKDRLSVAADGWLDLTWTSWGSTAERGFRLLPDGLLERRGRNPAEGPQWSLTRLRPMDAAQERLLMEQIAIETTAYKARVDAQVQVLMAESAERRRQNREKFWEGVGQAAVVLGAAVAEVAAERAATAGATGAATAMAYPSTPTPGASPGDPTREAGRAGTGIAAAAAPGAPLRFVMTISLLNKPGDTVNPNCYSNVVTRPGPPGWGAPGWLPSGSAERATQSVQALKQRFIAACRATGREITSEGNFTWLWNQSPGDEDKVARARARYREDVTVSVD
ncbi:MAG: hypothetical protein EOP62_21565 [Sphingomonadales bacterium]|nr:MAG: hypothetical protein EOP62_21565 [Sphingomonadales bacterium]